jgi:hypothetical protein
METASPQNLASIGVTGTGSASSHNAFSLDTVLTSGTKSDWEKVGETAGRERPLPIFTAYLFGCELWISRGNLGDAG